MAAIFGSWAALQSSQSRVVTTTQMILSSLEAWHAGPCSPEALERTSVIIAVGSSPRHPQPSAASPHLCLTVT